MKKYYILLTLILLFGCDDDLPYQFTSVEGYVTDYYTPVPVAGISLIVTEIELFGEHNILDTLLSDSKGYYYFEFYNDSNRMYEIETLSSEKYAPSDKKTITEGENNIFDFSIKKYTQLHLICINKTNVFNSGHFINHNYFSDYEYIYCSNNQNCETWFHIIPEQNNRIQIQLNFVNEFNQIDSTLDSSINFFSGINDTTITYIY